MPSQPPSLPRALPRAALIALLGICTQTSALVAQDTQPGGGLQGNPTEDTSRLLPTNPFRNLLERGEIPDTFDAARGARRFRGFQTIAPPDFGSYPGGTPLLPFLRAGEAPLPFVGVAERDPNRWPTWLGLSGEGFVPEVAVVTHATDYVWVREAEEDAYVPLAPYQKFLVVKATSEVDVRGAGQYAIDLHGGGEVRVVGRSHMTLGALDGDGASLDFASVTLAFVRSASAPVRVHFGAEIAVESTDARLRFQLELDGSIACYHEYGSPATLVLRGERTTLERGHRLRLLPDAPHSKIALPLSSDGDIKLARDGRVLRAEGALRGGSVVWNGARFRVPGGGVLRIDPLVGKEFPASPADLP